MVHDSDDLNPALSNGVKEAEGEAEQDLSSNVLGNERCCQRVRGDGLQRPLDFAQEIRTESREAVFVEGDRPEKIALS